MIKYIAMFKEGSRIAAVATLLSDHFPLTTEEEAALKKEAANELDQYIANENIDRKLLLGPQAMRLRPDMYEYELMWTKYR